LKFAPFVVLSFNPKSLFGILFINKQEWAEKKTFLNSVQQFCETLMLESIRVSQMLQHAMLGKKLEITSKTEDKKK
jgi:hypothetical protein